VPEASRRDFLMLRRQHEGTRAYDLWCGRLYMRYLEASGGEPEDFDQLRNRLDADLSYEPVPAPAGGGARQLFERLESDLREVDVLRVRETDWLTGDDLRGRLDAVLQAFRARGGRVEFGVDL
jgi:hypothetical protein